MNNTTSSVRPQGFSRQLAAAAILGGALLVGGIGLAVYSLVFAAGNPFAPHIASEDLTGKQLGLFGVVIGTAALLILAATLRWSVSLRAAGIGNPFPVIMVAVLGIEILVTVDLGIRATVERVFGSYTAYPELPTAVAAWYLVIVGSAFALAVTCAPPALGALSARTGATCAAVGVLVCALATGFALRAGDDSRFSDHRTASATAIAPVPESLGTEKFRVDLTAAAVVVGGNGFIVGSIEGLTAYDGATGAPRWHHLRPEAATHGVRHNPRYLQSIPSENVVVSYWNNWGWLAFDASTGEKLWSDAQFSADAGPQKPFGDFNTHPQPLLIRETGPSFVRYDARTGQQMWSSPTDESCRDMAPKIAVTTRAIYQVSMCNGSLSTRTTIVAFDPATGSVRTEREITHPANRAPRLTVVDEVVSIEWRAAAGAHSHLRFSSPAQLSTATPSESFTLIAADLSAGTLVGEPGDGPVVVSETGGPSRSLPADSRTPVRDHEVVLLASELVVISAGELQTWRRGDLSPSSAGPALRSCSPYEVTSAPGVVLVFCANADATTRMVGFAP
ncbi:PQQ-binding-like beta-propeller repeat protein [Nocardia halotolerans]|uniref:PQQ-binding-like beta-propeller repeat protein n=1 Tax=Nocardia halotolerans TaxID=1755878 RepID=A0ABV8VHS8_9NOCA